MTTVTVFLMPDLQTSFWADSKTTELRTKWLNETGWRDPERTHSAWKVPRDHGLFGHAK